jgi:aerobic-type carbon monoxide dehydrogenase small subunit (CoxS/CutS family)
MPEPSRITLIINDQPREVTTEPQRSLLEVLREDLELTGTKYGCGEGACGACAVLIDGKRSFSCSTPVSQTLGKKITTIEGLSKGDELHPVQEAFLKEEASQCGYCTAGMCIGAAALLQQNPKPTDEQIVKWMSPHICRCCAYTRIVSAVRRAAQ